MYIIQQCNLFLKVILKTRCEAVNKNEKGKGKHPRNTSWVRFSLHILLILLLLVPLPTSSLPLPLAASQPPSPLRFQHPKVLFLPVMVSLSLGLFPFSATNPRRPFELIQAMFCCIARACGLTPGNREGFWTPPSPPLPAPLLPRPKGEGERKGRLGIWGRCARVLEASGRAYRSVCVCVWREVRGRGLGELKEGRRRRVLKKKGKGRIWGISFFSYFFSFAVDGINLIAFM